MNNNYVFYNGEEYLIEDGNISKIVNGEFEMPSKREIEDIEDYLEQNVFFASKKLNDIALANPELIKCDILIDVISTLDSFIPKNLKELFYTNLKTLKVSIGYDCANKYNLPYAHYCVSDNTISFPIELLKKIKNDFTIYNSSHKAIKDYLFHIFLHEMLHSSARDCAKECRYVYSFFDEGMTETIVVMLNHSANAYTIERKIILQLSAFIPFDSLLECYFKGNEINILVKQLMNVIPDDVKAWRLIKDFERGCLRENPDNERYEYLLKAQNSMLDYINCKCDILSNNNMDNELKDLLDSINTNYIGYELLSKFKIDINNNNLQFNDLKLKELNDKYNKQKQLTI